MFNKIITVQENKKNSCTFLFIVDIYIRIEVLITIKNIKISCGY